MNSRLSNVFDGDIELESNLSFALSDTLTWGASILCPSSYIKKKMIINHHINLQRTEYFTKRNKNSTCLVLFLMIQTHTHTYIYSYIYLGILCLEIRICQSIFMTWSTPTACLHSAHKFIEIIKINILGLRMKTLAQRQTREGKKCKAVAVLGSGFFGRWVGINILQAIRC